MIREFCLDGWRALPELHQLVGPAGPVKIEAHSMEVLIALAERAGKVVSREDLLDRVWGELFVGEEVLSHAIWDLRRALGDDPRRPRFIQTYRKRGYRLVAKISWLEHGVGESGRYRLLEQIGGGAMGIVFQGEDTRLERTVALKFLPPEWSRDELAKTRFLREARTAAALDHPNLCSLYEIDETDDGRLFLVMPFYRGETLQQVLDRGPIAPDRVVELGIEVAAGLEALHRAGIVHRDIKPGNILVTAGGAAKILDFGLAMFAGSTRLTRSDSSPGTPAYMSPEQVRGEDATPASDVWSLGAVLFEVCCGRPPFGGGNEEATFFNILNSAPTAPESLPAGLARVIEKALTRGPERRFQNGGELRKALLLLRSEADPATDDRPLAGGERPAAGPDSSSGPPPAAERRHRLRVQALAAAAMLLAVILTALWSAQRSSPRRRPATSDEAPPRVVVWPLENRTSEPRLTEFGVIATDLIRNGIASTDRVMVVPADETSRAIAAIDDDRLAARSGAAIGRATGARLMVKGFFYLVADELRIRADLIDVESGDIVRGLEPVASERRSPEVAAEALRDRLMTLVALHHDLPELPARLFSHLPSYEAYREFWAALSVPSIADADRARDHLVRAYELEPDFAMAGLVAVGSPLQLLPRSIGETVLLALDDRRHALTPFERHLTNAFLNQTRGRWTDALLQLREAERLAPRSPWVNAQISNSALWVNRPREALEAMDKIPLETIRSPFARWRRVINRGYALHALGRYEEEVEYARRARRALPNLPTEPIYAEVRGLAALGRLEELDQALARSSAAVTPVWPEDDGWLYLASALQLRAHGRAEEARRYAERVVDLCRQHDCEQADDPRILGWALWLLGRHDEAYAHHAALLADSPNRIWLRGEVGCLAALRGEREEALRHARLIAENPKPNLYGMREIARGLIMAHLGDRERAVELLAQGLAAGDSYKEFRVHYHVFLSPLLDYPPYQDLVRPRG